MAASTVEQMGTHLEFLGYEVSRDDQLTKARHPRKLNFAMRPLAGGILFTAIFGCSEDAKRNRPGYLEMINSLNDKAVIARFYADKDSDFFIEAWHPDHYERAAFGAFMQVWDRDCGLMADHSEAAKFLR